MSLNVLCLKDHSQFSMQSEQPILRLSPDVILELERAVQEDAYERHTFLREKCNFKEYRFYIVI